MTLDEAIKHAEEVAKQNEEDAVIYSNCKNHKQNLYEIGLAENAEKKCCKCAEEHRQLAEWLKELKRLREQTRWTPCSERLPKKPGQYYVSGGDKVWICEYLIIPNSIGGWCNDVANPVVQAWMPRPEPWKGEDNG